MRNGLNSRDSRWRPCRSRRSRLAGGLFSLLILSASPAFAQVPDELISAAESGVASAQYEVGKRFERGEGVEADDFIALRWFRRAAENGHAEAALDLGWMLANGYGAPRDVEEAYYWFTVAAAGNIPGAAIQRQAVRDDLPISRIAALDAKAANMIGDVPKTTPPTATDTVPAPPLPEEMIDNAAGLRKLFWTTWGPDYPTRVERLAQSGDPVAQNLMGLLLVRTTDPERQKSGIDWLFQAARSGMVAAQYNLADAYLDRRLGMLDPDAAARWLEQAKHGLPADTGQTDYATASRLFREKSEYRDPYRAAMLGYESARDALAQLVEAGLVEARAMIELNRRTNPTTIVE